MSKIEKLKKVLKIGKFFFTFFTFFIRLHIMGWTLKIWKMTKKYFLEKSEKNFGPLGHFLFLTHFTSKCVKIKKNFSKTAKKTIYIMKNMKNIKKPWTFLTHFEAKCVKIFWHMFFTTWQDIQLPHYVVAYVVVAK